jgi:hypothetical protein
MIDDRIQIGLDREGGLKVVEFAYNWQRSHAANQTDGLRVVVFSSACGMIARAKFNKLIPESCIRFFDKSEMRGGEMLSSIRDFVLAYPVPLNKPSS